MAERLVHSAGRPSPTTNRPTDRAREKKQPGCITSMSHKEEGQISAHSWIVPPSTLSVFVGTPSHLYPTTQKPIACTERWKLGRRTQAQPIHDFIAKWELYIIELWCPQRFAHSGETLHDVMFKTISNQNSELWVLSLGDASPTEPDRKQGRRYMVHVFAHNARSKFIQALNEISAKPPTRTRSLSSSLPVL